MGNVTRLVTVTVEEDQIYTPTCSPGAFIQHYYLKYFASWFFNQTLSIYVADKLGLASD